MVHSFIHTHTEAEDDKWLDLHTRTHIYIYILIFSLLEFQVLTVCPLFPCKSESDRLVTEAGREVLCCPAENRPIQRHVDEDCRLLKMKQNLLDLIWAEGFQGVGLRHGLSDTREGSQGNEKHEQTASSVCSHQLRLLISRTTLI